MINIDIAFPRWKVYVDRSCLICAGHVRFCYEYAELISLSDLTFPASYLCDIAT